MKNTNLCYVLLTGLSSLLVACTTVGPKYEQPTGGVGSQWLEFEDPALKTKSPVEPRWWKTAFHDPSLDRLVSKALKDNLNLRAAAQRVLQAQQQLQIANGSLYPQEQYLGAVAARTDSGPPINAYSVYNANFNLSWEVDVWGRIRSQINSASAMLDASMSAYDGIMVSLISQVAQTYIVIRTTEQRLAVTRQNVTYQEESVRISKEKLDVGEISALDVEQGKTLLHATRASLALLEQSLQQSKIAMGVLLGELPQNAAKRFKKPGRIPAASPLVAVGMPQDLIRRRPDIRVAERSLAAQGAQINYAVSDLYPQFGLTGLIGPAVNTVGGKQFSDLFTADSMTYSFGGIVRWDILNYGRIKNNIRLQDAKFQELLESYRQTVLQAQAEVASSLIAFYQSQVQLREMQQSADAAQRAADIAMEQYEDGAVDFNTVVSTLRSLLSQQDQLASLRGTVAVNLVEVYGALGGGWEISKNKTVLQLIPQETQAEMKARGKYWDSTMKKE